MYIGDYEITKVYLGDTEVQKMYLGDVLVYGGGTDWSQEPLTFLVHTGGTITWKSLTYTRTIEYSINGGSWTSITSDYAGRAITVSAGDTVKLRGTNNTYTSPSNSSYYSGFGSGTTATFDVCGNILSMIYGSNFQNYTELPSDTTYNFGNFFGRAWKDQFTGGVVSAENLILPANTMQGCYSGMFTKNGLMTTPPALPSTAVTISCYSAMFGNNPALVTAPALPAETLARDCYQFLFYNCSLIDNIECLATDISATNCLYAWVQGVAASGTFVKNQNMSSWPVATSANDYAGIPRNWTVQDAS